MTDCTASQIGDNIMRLLNILKDRDPAEGVVP